MLIKMQTIIVADVKNDEQASEACMTIENGLAHQMNTSGFPAGEIVDVTVDHYKQMTQDEIEELGLDEV